MRIDLFILSALAATALGALIDAARRAAPGADDEREHDVSSGVVPRARIEELERAFSRVDDHAARMLLACGLGATALGAIGHALGITGAEVAAVMVAAGLGLALPGVSWVCDVHRRRAALVARIDALRARASMLERSRGAGLTRSGAPRLGA